MIRSLRIRLMLGAAALAVLFMLALLPALQRAFGIALENTIEQRLAADVATLVSAARVEKGRLVMPEHLPVEEFNLPEAKVLGYIYDQNGDLLWRSTSAADESINYTPRYDGRGNEFHTTRDAKGEEFFVFDVEIDLLRGKQAAYSIVTMQSVSEFESLLKGFREQLYLWLGGALLVLLGLLWLGLTWGFRAMRGLSSELDQIESGERESLSEEHPRELLRLTHSLNRLLRSEHKQRERYRHSLGDLAHSLKTPLAVLQGRRPARRGARQPRAGAGATGPDRAHEPADRLSVAARQPAQERPGTPSRATGAAGGDPVRRAGQGLSRQAGKPCSGTSRRPSACRWSAARCWNCSATCWRTPIACAWAGSAWAPGWGRVTRSCGSRTTVPECLPNSAHESSAAASAPIPSTRGRASAWPWRWTSSRATTAN